MECLVCKTEMKCINDVNYTSTRIARINGRNNNV